MHVHVLSTYKHFGYKKRDNAVGHFYNQKKKPTKKQETQHYNSVPT